MIILLISLLQLLVKFVRKGFVVYVRVMLPHGRHEHLFVSFYISLCVVPTTIAYLMYVSPVELLNCGYLVTVVICRWLVFHLLVRYVSKYNSNVDRLLPQ